MKLSLRKKFILCYLLVAVLSILFIGTAGHTMVLKSQLGSLETRLYNEANHLASLYGGDFERGYEQLLTHEADFDEIEAALDCTIWFLDKNGTLIYPLQDQELVVSGFDPTAADSHHGFLGHFFGSISENTVSVYAPMVNGFSTSGYVILHCPASDLESSVNDTLNVVYLTALVMFLLSLLLLLLLHRSVLRPTRQITTAAKEYAAGNLSYEYSFHSQDEMGVLSETLSYMATALSQTSEDQRKFITNVSHDFRSPLTSIKGYIEAILDGTIPPSMQEKYLRIVQDETDRLNKLTQSLLDANTFSGNGMLLDYTDFDVHHIIKKILATFEGRCTDKHITFELTFTAREFYVHADEGRIQQVLYNLIDNAIKFSNPGSTIFIETYEKREKAYISVKDQGVGIPADSIKKIWDRFYKTDTSRGKDKKGLGLGLSITKDIIQAHGENIDVISTEGVGTEFIFTLPLAKQPV
jgi:signal transduction histidine kinase